MDEKRKKLLPRVLWVTVANLILGLGIAMLRLSGFGTDPFTCMNLGVSSHLPVSFDVYQMIFNVLLFIPVFILDRKSFGIGALINMLLLGYFVEFFMFLFAAVGITIEGMAGNMAMRIPALVVGILVLCFGVALYMACDLGLMTGSVVSIGTVIVALFTGPIVSFFRDTAVARIMRGIRSSEAAA